MDDPPSPGSPEKESEVELLENKNQYSYSSRSAYAQFLAVLVQSFLLVDLGLIIGIPTLILGALHEHPEEDIQMDDHQASWFVSIPTICTPIASLAGGYFQEKLGRKLVLILCNVPYFAVWVSLHYADSVLTLYACAVVMGLSNGLFGAPLSSYIGEIGEPHLRGTLSVVPSVAVTIGMLTMFILGYFYDWRTAALISSACPVLTLALMTQIPKSPIWLIRKNKLEDAKKSLCWLRGWTSSDEVENEFQDLISHTQNHKDTSYERSEGSNTENTHAESDESLMAQFKLMGKRNILIPFRLVMITSFFTYVAVLMGMQPYFINEVNKLGSPVDPKILLIIGQVLFLFGAAFNMTCLRRLGKRKFALISFALAAPSILGIGLYSSILQTSQPSPLAWLPIILLRVISFLGGLSLFVLPGQLACEVFPPKGRGLANGLSSAWSHLVMTAMFKSYLYIKHLIEFSGVMCLHAALTTLGLLYLYLHLPETEGKSLEEIESYFQENHDRERKFKIAPFRRKVRRRIQ